jgi:predicted Holliday junction resolvase-like endonuclease
MSGFMKKGKIILTGLAVLVLLLVIVNILLMAGNQSLQLSVNERQQYIAETIQLETLNRQVIGVLAEMALKTNDGELKKLLAGVGIDLSPTPPQAPAPKSK